MGINIAFWILSVLAVVSAISVVVSKDLFRSALLLVLCFTTVAGIYATLAADFLTVAQILVYVGAVAVLVIFAVMLTRQVQRGNPFNKFASAAFLICIWLLAVFVLVVIDTEWPTIASPADITHIAENALQDSGTTTAIAGLLFDKDAGFLLPFEIAAVLLLAAVIGAIALVRDK